MSDGLASCPLWVLTELLRYTCVRMRDDTAASPAMCYCCGPGCGLVAACTAVTNIDGCMAGAGSGSNSSGLPTHRGLCPVLAHVQAGGDRARQSAAVAAPDSEIWPHRESRPSCFLCNTCLQSCCKLAANQGPAAQMGARPLVRKSFAWHGISQCHLMPRLLTIVRSSWPEEVAPSARLRNASPRACAARRERCSGDPLLAHWNWRLPSKTKVFYFWVNK